MQNKVCRIEQRQVYVSEYICVCVFVKSACEHLSECDSDLRFLSPAAVRDISTVINTSHQTTEYPAASKLSISA